MGASQEHEALRLRVASEEGVRDLADRVRGRTEAELRRDAVELRCELGRDTPSEHPSPQSAVAAARAQAERNARAWH